MNLRQIEVFRAVMVAGSVTDAARLLNVSQPGISRMLSHIELQLGVQLFDRTKGKLRPLPEAQFLYDTVEQVYRGVQRIDDVAQALKHGGGQTLRVLASPSLSLEAAPRAVAQVVQKFQQVHLYVETLLVRDMVAQLARAIGYTLTRLGSLTRYLDDGRIEIDNNAAERALRGVSLGRKNFMFMGSDAGGERAAAIYSLVETSKLNGLDPEAYLRDVLGRIADHPICHIEELLPWNIAQGQPAEQRLAA